MTYLFNTEYIEMYICEHMYVFCVLNRECVPEHAHFLIHTQIAVILSMAGQR